MHEPTDQPSDPTPETPDTTDPQLSGVVRRNLVRLLISLILLGLGAGALVFHFGDELHAATTWAFDTLGLGGLVLLIFVTDAFVSPFPPDTVLLLISASSWAKSWWWLIPAIGIVSSCAGLLGYGCGRFFARRAVAQTLFGPFREKSGPFIVRYGAWAVAMGALTPVPFSITCWTAGLLEVPLRRVWPPCLLRVPRYVIYYAVLSSATRLFS